MERVTRPWGTVADVVVLLDVTGRGRARGGVWRRPGAEARRRTGADGEGQAEATGRCALWHALASRPCTAWRRWSVLGALVLACARGVLVKGVHEPVQESERELLDKVVQG